MRREYSNLGAGLLGDLLSQQAAMPYASLLEKKVLQPLGMGDSGVRVPLAEGRSFALPHGSGLFPNHNWAFDALVGAGGIRSTAKDMIPFIQAWLHPPEGTLGQAMDLAWKESLPAKDRDLAMGLGWMIARDGSTRWHNGMTGGFQSILYVSRKHDAGVILLSNTADSHGDKIGDQILRTILGQTVKPTVLAAGPELDPEEWKRLPGRYRLSREVVIEVWVKNGRMQVQLTGQPASRLDPESLTHWSFRGVKARLAFDLQKEGPSQVLTLHQNGGRMRATRIE
jgi:CubicO group peptidase (beta-lactamase class C family)